MDTIQSKYGARSPEYMAMLLAKRLNGLTKALIGLTVVLHTDDSGVTERQFVQSIVPLHVSGAQPV